MKRRLPDLSHVLDESRPLPVVPILEKRIHTRFDKAFLVVIGSELYGDSFAIARNISAGGCLVEMSYAPPLGTIVTVHFQHVRYADVPEAEFDRALRKVASSPPAPMNKPPAKTRRRRKPSH